MRYCTNGTDITYTFAKPELVALAAAISDDVTRPALNALRLGSDGAAVTTDGHRLVCCRGVSYVEPIGVDEKGLATYPEPPPAMPQKESLLSLDTVKAAIKACPAKGEARITPNCTTVAIEAGPSTLTAKLVDAVFPPYERVIPAEKETGDSAPARIGINAAYLADLALIQKAIDPKGRKGIVMRSYASVLDPIRFDAESTTDGTTWTAVIMPMLIK